jgi:cellulose synthase (UDP-forming)
MQRGSQGEIRGGFRERAAAALGIRADASAAAWFWRLWILPAGQARPLPWPVGPVLRAVVAAMAQALGVERIRRIDDWLIRLLLLPQQAPRDRHWHVPWLASVLAAVGWLFLLPGRLIGWMADRLDHSAIGRSMAAGGDQVGDWPQVLKWLVLAGASVLLWLAVSTPLGPLQQLLFFVLIWTSAMVIRRLPGNLVTLLMIMLSLVASGRYIWWRLTSTLEFDSVPEYVLGYGLVLAEAYTWLIMLLGYIQNAWPLRRPAVALPADRSRWPTIDVFVPSYNEPLNVVKPTLYAALGMDWPRDKLRVWLLDDGRRPEFRQFCEQLGCGYLTRADNSHAKAGNINAALRRTEGEFVVIFDCDHVPVRSFLRDTLGWFYRDPKCALLQTPHHFFSPDPFERNLGTFKRVPNEGSLFYGLVQDGNDFWNATFFCGSCAVLRRGPLEEIGGIAVETVTEDAHTALRLHRRGYTSAYLNKVLAAGLATESLSGHVGQRIRWARGMAQIFRTDNPLFGKGLQLWQRLCYSNAMLHFFHGIPRLVFLTAPLAFLFFGWHVISAAAGVIAVYVLPHLFLSALTNTRMQGLYRHSHWAEVYESVLAWYITLPTTIAFINPKLGKFNVTAKGGLVRKEYFDFRIARPYLLLMAVNFSGVILGFYKLLAGAGSETGTLLINLAWALYNLLMLGTAIAVATETRQVRKAHRVPVRIGATIRRRDGTEHPAETNDFSMTGLGIQLRQPADIAAGEVCEVLLHEDDTVHAFPITVTQVHGLSLGVEFKDMTPVQEAQLIHCTFGRPEVWIESRKSTPDRPMAGLAEVLEYGLRGYARLIDRGAAAFERSLRGNPSTETGPR